MANVFLDPNHLHAAEPAEILEAAAQGHLGLDHRFLKALLDRPDRTIPALVEFAKQDRKEDAVGLTGEVVALFRMFKTPEAMPFIIELIKEDPTSLPDELTDAVVEIGAPALEPLLQLYSELEEEQAGEVAFLLASLRIRDPRVLEILNSRLEYDMSDTVLLFGIYGDPAAVPALDTVLSQLKPEDARLRAEVEDVKHSLSSPEEIVDEHEPYDIWEEYPAEADVPVDSLDEDERTELLDHPIEAVRAAAANSFFNRDLTPEQVKRLVQRATADESAVVRARAWEALSNATEDIQVVEAMLNALRKRDLPAIERGGLLVGLSSEGDRKEVRAAIEEAYKQDETRAKALEAMWRSMHPSFRERFARHLKDPDLEVRRAAVWGVGYYSIRSELDTIRNLLQDEDLRSDALFAYTLALPGEVSRGRVNGMLSRVEKDARGLSEMEEELVKAALDEKLMLAGKEPFFAQQED